MALTPHQRAVLHDLRIAFARARGKLSTDTRRLSQRVGFRVSTAQLETLNHAGFIEFCSREALDQRLEKFYASRARARGREKEEEEVEKESSEVSATRTTDPPPPAEPYWPPNANGSLAGLNIEDITPELRNLP